MKFIVLLLAVFVSPGFASEALNSSNKFLDKDKTHITNKIDNHSEEIIKTVITKGYGTSIDDASLNAAEDALSQIVGSFIDSETIIKRKKEIKEGIINRSKIINKDVRNYSQGSIKYFEVLDIKNNGPIFIVEAKVGVRFEDLKTYIKQSAFGKKSLENINLFAEMKSKQNNLNNKSNLLKKIIHPIERGEVTEITIGELMSFQDFVESGKCVGAFTNRYLVGLRYWRNIDVCTKSAIGGMDPEKVVIFNFSLKLKDSYLENIYNTFDNISDYQTTIPNNHQDYYSRDVDTAMNVSTGNDVAVIIRDYRSEKPSIISNSYSGNNKTIKTVIATGYGSNLNEAVLNGAQDALKQVVGSFIDSEILIKKETAIDKSVINRTKNIKKDITNYSQGSIKRFEVLDVRTNNSVFVVKARADVRVEDFKEYINNSAFSRKKFDDSNTTFYLLKGIGSRIYNYSFDQKCSTKSNMIISFMDKNNKPIKSFEEFCRSGFGPSKHYPQINYMIGQYKNRIYEEYFKDYASYRGYGLEQHRKEHKLTLLNSTRMPHFLILNERRFWFAVEVDDLSELTDFKEIQIKFVK